MTREIVVIGYPRSGNTWLSRLLGDLLDSPVGGLYNAKPLATEGGDRPGPFKVLQLHLKPVHEMRESVLPSAWGLCVPLWKGNPPIVHVVRDPRDVVVSAWKYWNIKNLDDALSCVGAGLWPLKAHGAWSPYVSSWLDIDGVQMVKYEDLHTEPERVLRTLLDAWGLRIPGDVHMARVIDRQGIERKRAEIAAGGKSWEYGEDIQLKHLRKGIAGDWRNHFNEEQLERARGYFGEVAERIGYEL